VFTQNRLQTAMPPYRCPLLDCGLKWKNRPEPNLRPDYASDVTLMFLLHSNLILKSSLIGGFQYDLTLIQKWLTFYWAT